MLSTYSLNCSRGQKYCQLFFQLLQEHCWNDSQENVGNSANSNKQKLYIWGNFWDIKERTTLLLRVNTFLVKFKHQSVALQSCCPDLRLSQTST